jgi:hypothetical protein
MKVNAKLLKCKRIEIYDGEIREGHDEISQHEIPFNSETASVLAASLWSCVFYFFICTKFSQSDSGDGKFSFSFSFERLFIQCERILVSQQVDKLALATTGVHTKYGIEKFGYFRSLSKSTLKWIFIRTHGKLSAINEY